MCWFCTYFKVLSTMKQIILIEDRVERMKRLAPIKFESIPFLKLITASKYDEFIFKLKKGELEFLNDFDCIISHKSALSVAQRDIIKKYCKSFNKTLVFFSGGISYSFYNDDIFPYLNINVKEFYSDNLKLFLNEVQDNNKINVSILQFGEKWKLNKLLNFRNDLITKINGKNINTVRDFNLTEELKRELIISESYEFLNNDFSTIDNIQIASVKTKIDNLINELI